jgi:uncharacterized membrane-anchored protein
MSMKTLRTIILFGTLLVFLYLVNTGIWGAEQNIENGTPVYLELAPVDPRSLIQGDYMALDYQIERDANQDGLEGSHRGQVVARLDENNVAHYDRVYTDEPLADKEILLNYTVSEYMGVRIGVDSFFFQEGQARDYALAQYADVRVTADGTVMLVNLVGEGFKQLVEQNNN